MQKTHKTECEVAYFTTEMFLRHKNSLVCMWCNRNIKITDSGVHSKVSRHLGCRVLPIRKLVRAHL